MIENHPIRSVSRLDVLLGAVAEIVEDTTAQEPSPDWHLERVNPELGNNLGVEYDKLKPVERAKTRLLHGLLKMYNYFTDLQINNLFKANISNTAKNETASNFNLPGNLVREFKKIAKSYPNNEILADLFIAKNEKRHLPQELKINMDNSAIGQSFEGSVAKTKTEFEEYIIGAFHKHPKYLSAGKTIRRVSEYGAESFSIQDLKWFLENRVGSSIFFIEYYKKNKNGKDDIMIAALTRKKEQGLLFGGVKVANELDWFDGWLKRLNEYCIREDVTFPQTQYKDLLLKLVSKLGFNYYEGTLSEGEEVKMYRL